MDREMDSLVQEVTTNFKRGTTEMLLLALLKKQDCYAYQLSKELEEASGGLFDIQGPSLYTALYRMEKRGFVSTETQMIGRRPRVYYHLLPQGEVFLQKLLREYDGVQQGVHQVLSLTIAPGEECEEDE